MPDNTLKKYVNTLWGLLADMSPTVRTQRFEQIQKLNRGYVQDAVNEAREYGFKASYAACTFDKDCKSCEANRLTLDFLQKPERNKLTKGETDASR